MAVWLDPGDGVLLLTGAAGSKGTTNWPETAHSAIWPRAKMYKIGALGPPSPTPRRRPPEGQHPDEGALFFYTLSLK